MQQVESVELPLSMGYDGHQEMYNMKARGYPA